MKNTIKKTFNIEIPEDFLHENILTPRSQDWEYIGDEFIYVYVDKITNIASLGTLSEEMYNDGRPIPLDKYVVKVDAKKEPLIASLLCGPYKTDNKFEINRPNPDILIDSHPDYGEYKISSKFHVSELFSNIIKYDPINQKWILTTLHYTDILNVKELTWDMLRTKRDSSLKSTDGMESGDMPETMITELREYRRKLREWPNVMADKDPWIAYNLFPKTPKWI